MIKSKGIFAVSFIAMMVAGGAYANIASQGYVDQQIDTRQVAGDYATNTALGTVRTTATDAKSAAAAAQTAADDAADAAAAAQTTANGKVTANAAITAGTATKITYDAKGLVTGGASLTASDIPTIPSTKVSGLGTLATKSAVTSAEITDGTITNADIATNAAIAQSKISGLTTALAGKANTADVPTKTSDLTNDSGFITEDDLPDGYTLPVATANTLGGVKSGGNITVGSDGAVTVNQAARATTATTATNATNATKATNDADGNEITETYATKDEMTSGLAGKQATLSAAQLNAVNSGITSTKVSTYDGYSAKITAAQDAADDAATAAAAAQSTASGKLSSISGSTGGTGNVVTSVSASGSTVSATKGITAEETKNKVTSVRAAASATDTAYPSEKAVATALAAKANTSALSGYATTSALGAVEDKAEAAQSAASAAQTAANGKVSTAQGTDNANDVMVVNASGNVAPALITNANISSSAAIAQSKISGLTDALAGKLSTTGTAARATADASGNNIASTYATKTQITALNSSSDGTGAVVTGVSQTGGKVSVTKGNVKIPFGGQNATDYAAIWVE